jgi:hypothetical protein
MDNNLYNLMTQMTIEQRSLWRVKKHYLEECSSEEERVFWKNLITDKENHIKEMKELIKGVLT